MHVKLQCLQSEGKGVGALFLPPTIPFYDERGVSASADTVGAIGGGGAAAGVDRGTEGELGAVFVPTVCERQRRRI